MDHASAAAVNRAHWDALAAVHAAGGAATSYYDADALVAGRDSLTDAEHAAVEAAVGGVAGLDVLHVQCHLGYDSISLARARGGSTTWTPGCGRSRPLSGPAVISCSSRSTRCI